MQANEAEQQAVDNRLAIFHAREFPGVQLKYHDKYKKQSRKVTVYFFVIVCHHRCTQGTAILRLLTSHECNDILKFS